MSRKLLIEITEEEYEKIKSGFLDKDPEVIVKTREIPKIMNVQFKFKVGEEVIFTTDIFGKPEEHTGEIVGYIMAKLLPNGIMVEELKPIYIIQFIDDRYCGEKSSVFVEEKDVKSIVDEAKDKGEAL